MRKAINDNPIAQVGVLAALALVVGFLVITRMSHKSSESSTTPTTSASSVAPAAPSSSDSTTVAPSPSTPSVPVPDSTATPAPAAPSGTAPSGTPTAKFVAGPGLPEPVVRAYEDNQVVVLLVVRRHGIDDDAVKAGAESLRGVPTVSLFVTNAGHIARYSRIAAGVNVDRVPALIVLKPKNLTKGNVPEATVSYGFRGPDSVDQAIRNALYDGPTDVPYYPK